jgi:hypothetical protein
LGILAPTAWNFAGSARNSLISWSSSTASSEPATSENVTLGMSLLTSRARDLPKFMTREPPPCIWPMRNQKMPRMMMSGRTVMSRLDHQDGFGTESSKPFGGLASVMASMSWVPRCST